MKCILSAAAVALAFLLGGNNFAKAGYFDPGASLEDQSVTLDKCSGVAQCLPNFVVPGYLVLLKHGDNQCVRNWADVVEFTDHCVHHEPPIGIATQYGACEGFCPSLVADINCPTANVVYLDECTLRDGDRGADYEAGDACYTIEDPCSCPAVPLPAAALLAPAATALAALFARKLRKLA